MKLFLVNIFTFLLLFSCVENADQLEVDGLEEAQEARRVSSPSNISSVSIVDNQLVLQGTNLDTINDVRVMGPTFYSSQPFIIETKTQNKIVANSIRNIKFAIAEVFSLMTVDAIGSATYNVTFSLPNDSVTSLKIMDGSVTAAKISDMDADPGQFLRFDGTNLGPADLNTLTYAGTWDASSATEPNASAVDGEFYIVDTAGSSIDLLDGNGARNWSVGDWDQVGTSIQVSSFNGRTGAVTPLANDYTWAQIDKTTAPIGDISNIDTTGASSGQVLKFNGTNWAPANDDNGSTAENNLTGADDNVTVNADDDGDGTGDINFLIDSSTKMTISNNGDVNIDNGTLFIDASTNAVGIGVTAPSYDLSFSGDSDQAIEIERHTTADTAGSDFFLYTGGATSGATDKDGGDLYVASGTATGTGSSKIFFQTATPQSSTNTTDNSPSTKMTIDGDGNVGVGTISPKAKLQIGSVGGMFEALGNLDIEYNLYFDVTN